MNAQVVGISVDNPFANKAFSEKLGLTYPLLSDFGRKLTTEWDLLETNEKSPVYRLAKRAWVIIDKQGIIRFKQINPDARQLIPTDEILKALEGLS